MGGRFSNSERPGPIYSLGMGAEKLCLMVGEEVSGWLWRLVKVEVELFEDRSWSQQFQKGQPYFFRKEKFGSFPDGRQKGRFALEGDQALTQREAFVSPEAGHSSPWGVHH
jgi:hypothetical protein